MGASAMNEHFLIRCDDTPCPECDGFGEAWGSRCGYCNGSGLLPSPDGELLVSGNPIVDRRKQGI
jgi:hypothetical protein